MHGWLTAIDARSGTVQWRYQSSRHMVAAVTATSTDLVFTGEFNGDFAPEYRQEMAHRFPI